MAGDPRGLQDKQPKESVLRQQDRPVLAKDCRNEQINALSTDSEGRGAWSETFHLIIREMDI